ncbi:MAG: hypothetical protein ACREOW_11420 [Thermodesulfobacteriota bacterium]
MTIEEFVFQCLGAQGWRGTWCEGSSFIPIIELVRQLVEGKGIRFFPVEWDISGRHFVREELSDKETHILWAAISVVTDRLLEGFYKEWQTIDPRNATKSVSLDQLLDIWHSFGQDEIHRICARAMLGFYTAWWPDLTLHRDGKIRFVEVKKGSDKFTHRQSYWVRNFALPLDWDVVVLNVILEK